MWKLNIGYLKVLILMCSWSTINHVPASVPQPVLHTWEVMVSHFTQIEQ